MVVDLPAPFGPRKPVTRPGPTTKETSSTAVVLRYRLVRCCASIIVRPFLRCFGVANRMWRGPEVALPSR
jgi:hypothetical protein